MKLPDGVVGLRKVKTVLGSEDARTHLTWVLAYNAGIEVGSPRYEAIRAFAGGLKPPRANGKPMEQSVMFLPVAPPDTSEAPPPRPRPARRKPVKKRRPQAALKRVAKRVRKSPVKRAGKTRGTARARRPASRSRR